MSINSASRVWQTCRPQPSSLPPCLAPPSTGALLRVALALRVTAPAPGGRQEASGRGTFRKVQAPCGASNREQSDCYSRRLRRGRRPAHWIETDPTKQRRLSSPGPLLSTKHVYDHHQLLVDHIDSGTLREPVESY